MLLDDWHVTLTQCQYDSTLNQDSKDKVAAASQLDLEESTEEDTDASGHSNRSAVAECNCRRNCAMWRECTQARHEFHHLKGRSLTFPLFFESTKEDAISYRDWHSKAEEALEKSYDPVKVKPCHTSHIIWKHLTSVKGTALTELDSVYLVHSRVFYVYDWTRLLLLDWKHTRSDPEQLRIFTIATHSCS